VRQRFPVWLALLLAGCTCPQEQPGPMVRGLLALAREAAQERMAQPPPPEADTLQRLDRLAREVRDLLHTKRPVEAMNEVLFARHGFAGDAHDLSLQSALLHQVLDRRRGSCIGLSGLYLALGERLNLPLAGVLVPQHMLVKTRGTAGRLVELLKQGRSMPRSWYVQRYAVPPGNPLYLETELSVDQTLAVLRYNLANDLRDHQRFRGALEHYRQVVAVLPRFAEAQANMALTLYRLGRLSEAEQAYRAAQAANPALPDLERNLRLLRREAGRPTSAPDRP